MASLVDTSVLLEALHPVRGGTAMVVLLALLGGDEIVFCHFNQCELLAGCRDDRDWQRLAGDIASKRMLGLTNQGWSDAARLYFDARRQGITVRRLIDCFIAQIALENNLRLIHNDRDFEMIGNIRALNQIRVNLRSVTP